MGNWYLAELARTEEANHVTSLVVVELEDTVSDNQESPSQGVSIYRDPGLDDIIIKIGYARERLAAELQTQVEELGVQITELTDAPPSF